MSYSSQLPSSAHSKLSDDPYAFPQSSPSPSPSSYSQKPSYDDYSQQRYSPKPDYSSGQYQQQTYPSYSNETSYSDQYSQQQTYSSQQQIPNRPSSFSQQSLSNDPYAFPQSPSYPSPSPSSYPPPSGHSKLASDPYAFPQSSYSSPPPSQSSYSSPHAKLANDPYAFPQSSSGPPYSPPPPSQYSYSPPSPQYKLANDPYAFPQSSYSSPSQSSHASSGHSKLANDPYAFPQSPSNSSQSPYSSHSAQSKLANDPYAFPNSSYHPSPSQSQAPYSPSQAKDAKVTIKFNSPATQYPPSYSPKRAVVVGICYFNNRQARLNGSLDDAKTIKSLLMSKFGFAERDILVLMDVPSMEQSLRPTRANIIGALKWLTSQAKAGESLFFFYGGHGSQVEDKSGDEADGMDETVLPEDYDTAGMIVDDELYDLLAAPLPRNAKLTCFFDCCHSGTALDLPYVYVNGRLNQERAAKKDTKGDVYLFSGCADDQVSKESAKKNVKTLAFSGIMTSSFRQAVDNPSYLTYQKLPLYSKHMTTKDMTIQLSSGKMFDLNAPFSL